MEIRIEDIERQQRYESLAVKRGVARYQKMLAETANVADTQPGMRAARDMLNGSPAHKGLIPAIKEAQQVAVTGIVAGPSKKTAWWWTVAFLEPEQLALLTVRAVLHTAVANRTLTSVALTLGNLVRQELELAMWRTQEAKKAKQDPEYTDLCKLLVSRAKKVDNKQFGRWRRKVREIERIDWDKTGKIQLGTMLIGLAVMHGGGWFAIRTIYIRGKSVKHVDLTPLGRAAIDDENARLELSRPLLLPMKCPPKPWQRKINE